ncbi:MAG: M20/M25/M40 family metallo-hydrolase [Planctomycetes bacterium]|nr:M20/M25/M40 family metallo-hydrolase [Planctomycetota bacterium]
MKNTQRIRERLLKAVRPTRLLDMATKLVAVPSRTGEAKGVLDCFADLLKAEGFTVERPDGGYPQAPAVAVRWHGKKPGKTLQFNGHLDTVHLPFVPPRVEGDLLRGSGSSDMKAGTAAAAEALLALRDADALETGAILLTAHDLHETPWGDGRQLNAMIHAGYSGDAVLLPEYLNEVLPVIGRGGLTWKISIQRPGAPVHEVMRPAEPNVIAVAAELVNRLLALDVQLSGKRDKLAGAESLFIGQIHSGEIFNQYPQECRLEGTRRWLPGTKHADVERQLRSLLDEVANVTGTTITAELCLMRDAFLLDEKNPFVATFQGAYQSLSGQALPIGAKPFCDDGNSFWALANIPAITHGPRAGGAHTLNEWVSIDDLARVAKLYASTAVEFC